MNKKKPSFDALFEYAASNMIAEFKKSASGMRADEIGYPRERQVRKFLKNWLPEKYGISKGYLISLDKSVSKECDIVIYDKDNCPKYVFDIDSDIRFFPKSEVFGAFEVKSTLDKISLQNSLDKVCSVKKIPITTIHDLISFTSDEWIDKDIKIREKSSEYSSLSEENFVRYKVKEKKEKPVFSNVFTSIFAFTSSEKYTLEKLIEKLKLVEYKNTPDLICILNKGLLVKNNEDTLKRYKTLKENKAIKDYVPDYDYFLKRLLSTDKDKSRDNYFILKSSKESVNLMYFYTFILDYLNRFKKYQNFYAGDMVSVWSKGKDM